MSKELPGDWGKLLGPKGIHSYRDMAAATGIATGTMHRLVTGKSTSVETVNRVADTFFEGDRDLVWRLRGSGRRDHGDWTLPPEASLLNEAQRSAVLAVIQAMVPAEQEEVMGNAGQHPAAMNLADRRGRLTPEERDKTVRAAVEAVAARTRKTPSRPDPQKTAGEENQDTAADGPA